MDRNVSIKVADFGLTRDIYETDYYIQRFNAKVPVKWMSPESLYDRISNEATDVVSTCMHAIALFTCMYCIAGNFRGTKYSWFSNIKTFRG